MARSEVACVLASATLVRAEHQADVAAWILLSSVFFVLVYGAVSVAAWPRAQPVFPCWLFVLAVLFPPAFVVLLVYLAFVPAPPVVLVTPAAPAARVVVRRPERV